MRHMPFARRKRNWHKRKPREQLLLRGFRVRDAIRLPSGELLTDRIGRQGFLTRPARMSATGAGLP